jgi:hypothetical protein
MALPHAQILASEKWLRRNNRKKEVSQAKSPLCPKLKEGDEVYRSQVCIIRVEACLICLIFLLPLQSSSTAVSCLGEVEALGRSFSMICAVGLSASHSRRRGSIEWFCSIKGFIHHQSIRFLHRTSQELFDLV